MKGVHPLVENAFRKGSRTYFNCAVFFPETVRRDVFFLYGFVRTADDFVDATPQDAEGFRSFRRRYEAARADAGLAGDPIIDSFLDVARRRGFEENWADAFLDAMEADLTRSRYETLDELLGYMHGSAEVIGFFMAAIMGLPPEARQAAAALGRSMQYINFIRDIQEDNALGRTYLPLAGSGLADLKEETARAQPEAFAAFIRAQVLLYRQWQAQARAGFGWIPWRSRVAVMTADRMYDWTAAVIYRDPFVVYRRKVKPSRHRILAELFLCAFRALGCRRR